MTARRLDGPLPRLLLSLLQGLWGFALGCGKTAERLEVSYTTTSGVECVEGTAACGSECVRLDSSSEHCGACGNACSGAERCDVGRCQPVVQGCSSPRLLCGGDCVDPLADRRHCGGCDQSCPAATACTAGACACPGARTLCGDACVDTSSDEQHCGSCDQRCPGTQTCEAGSCACPPGTELCASPAVSVADNSVTSGAGAAACVDTQSDGEHCGSCGVACRGGQVCQAGSCACPSGGLFCGERCVDPTRDAQNCGACSRACSGGQVCSAGSCACPPGQALCGGQCIDTQSNADHCGACDRVCGLGEGCSAGSCACPPGQALCGGQCIDTQSNADHCGACDRACGLSEGCSAGSCQSAGPGEDGCEGLVRGLSISQVSAYQTVESVIARDGAALPPDPALVAGRPTLVRVFVTPQADWVPREVSARLFLDNVTRDDIARDDIARDDVTRDNAGAADVILYSTSTLTPAAVSQQTDRTSTFEFLVPPASLTPDTRLALELVECNGPAPGSVSNARFPATGTFDLGAIDTGGLRIHIVPLRANGRLPDTSDDALALYRALFLDSYPISTLELSVGEPLDVADAEDWALNLDSVRALRQRENPTPDVYYYGMLRPADTFAQFCGQGCVAGIGYIATGRLAAQGRAALGLAYADVASAFIMLHEVGHNHGRQHAPCVPPGASINDVDPNYPQADGSIGTVGYNALGDQLISPASTDVMGYCNNQWFSAYTYAGLLQTVLTANQAQASEIVDPARVGSWQVLLADGARGLRWGQAVPSTSVAMGEEESAVVLDAAGSAVQSVRVYRTRMSDLDASSIQVPERRPGWSAIQLAGALPVAFPGSH